MHQSFEESSFWRLDSNRCLDGMRTFFLVISFLLAYAGLSLFKASPLGVLLDLGELITLRPIHTVYLGCVLGVWDIDEAASSRYRSCGASLRPSTVGRTVSAKFLLQRCS